MEPGRAAGYPRKRAKTRTELLRAARAVFATRGVEAATFAEIAAQAGVSPGTIYNYFATREALVDAVADEVLADFARVQTRTVREVADPAVRVAITIRRLYALARHDPLWAACLARLGPRHARFEDAVRPLALANLRAGIAAGRFRLPDAPPVLEMLVDLFHASMQTLEAHMTGADAVDAVGLLVLRALGLTPAEAQVAWARSRAPAAGALDTKPSPPCQ